MEFMRVKNLLEALAGVDPEALVIIARDNDGEMVSPVDMEAAYATGAYFPATALDGEFIDDQNTEYEDRPATSAPAICFWPTGEGE